MLGWGAPPSACWGGSRPARAAVRGPRSAWQSRRTELERGRWRVQPRDRRPGRHDHPQCQVGDDADAAAEDRSEKEGEPDERDRDPELLCQAAAHAGDPALLAGAVPGAVEGGGAQRAAAVTALDGLGADLLRAV